MEKQSRGLFRNTVDKFYTKSSVVDFCLEKISQNIVINRYNDIIIEPSAGNGAFVEGIKALSNKCLFYDIEPENAEIIKQDYLLLCDVEIMQGQKIHIIGNPPFGRQSSLAIQFIKKSCKFCDSMSFILPRSFKKDSLKSKVPRQFHLVFEVDLPEKSFLVEDEEYDVPCILQIWIKMPTPRKTLQKLSPCHFVFVDKLDNPDISLRRVGFYAGNIDTTIENKNTQSHYFIKFTNSKSLQENLYVLSNVKYECNNTVGPKSISKQEVIMKFNPLLEE
jgi:predicted RNA methylase